MSLSAVSSYTAIANFGVASSGENYSIEFNDTSNEFPALAQNMEWIVERLHGPKGDYDVTANMLNFNTIQLTNCAGATIMGSTAESSNATGVDMLAANTTGKSATTVINGQTVTVTWISA
jgi:hypothetical protein